MDEIISKARELGQLIARNERVQALLEARNALNADPTTRSLLEQHAALTEKVRTLRAEGKPIEPDDKRALADLEQQMAASPLFKALLRRQTDYVEMMTRVTRAMEDPLTSVHDGGDSA